MANFSSNKKVITFLLLFSPIIIMAQNVGIGTETPQEKLEVSEEGIAFIRITGENNGRPGLQLHSDGSNPDWQFTNGVGSLLFSKGQIGGFMTSRVIFHDNGRFGFGDTTPDADFEISKSGSQTDLRITSTNLIGKPNIDLMAGLEGFASYHWRLGQNNRDFVLQYGRNDFAFDSLEVMHVENTGNVGFGSNSPQQHLHVRGGADQFMRMETWSAGSIMTGYEMIRPGVDWRVVNDGGVFKIFDGNNNFSTDGDENFRIMASGNVGIGSTNPLTKLHIQGGTDSNLGSGGFITLGSISGLNVSYDNNEIQARNDGAAASLALQHSGGNLHLVNGGGNVGLGTNTPTAGLHIFNKDIRIEDSGNNLAILIDHNGSGNGGEIDLYNDAGNLMIEIEASELTGQGAEINMRNNAGSATVVLDADFNGKGRVITDELQIKGGSDLSEHFDISTNNSAALKPGMLVSIDPNNPGQLMITNEAYDHKVAGVISGANGIATGLIMGQEGSIANGDWPIALTGRVYVNADTGNGEIQPGDLLTSSNTPGFVMKATDLQRRNGAVIGKAMTGLVDGQGFVLILVSLQ